MELINGTEKIILFNFYSRMVKYFTAICTVMLAFCYFVLNIVVCRNIILDNFSQEKNSNFSFVPNPNSTSTINFEFGVEFKVNSTLAMLYIMSYFLIFYSMVFMCKAIFLLH